MDLVNIETFLHIVEVGSFSKAADDLGYAQSTVTAQIQVLEKELGHTLFERVGRKNHLTDAGTQFLQYARDIHYTLQKAATIGQQSDDAPVTLRIGVLESLLRRTALQIVPALRSRFRNARVFIKVGQAAELMQMLRQNQLDMAYISDEISTDPLLRCCYKRAERMVFLASTGHPCAGRSQLKPEDILAYPLIVTEPSGPCYSHLLRLAACVGMTPNYDVMVDNIGAIAELLADNVSAAFLPAYAMEQYGSSHHLTILEAAMPDQLYYSQILTRQSRWPSKAMEHFIHIVGVLYPET